MLSHNTIKTHSRILVCYIHQILYSSKIGCPKLFQFVLNVVAEVITNLSHSRGLSFSFSFFLLFPTCIPVFLLPLITDSIIEFKLNVKANKCTEHLPSIHKIMCNLNVTTITNSQHSLGTWSIFFHLTLIKALYGATIF